MKYRAKITFLHYGKIMKKHSEVIYNSSLYHAGLIEPIPEPKKETKPAQAEAKETKIERKPRSTKRAKKDD